MRSLNQKVVILTVLILSAVSFAGTYNGGGGVEGNPYQISNPGNWQELMTTYGDWNKHFILTADVNLAGVALTPVGNSTTKFTGVFDGNDNIISNTVINQPSSSYVGVFGGIGFDGQIRNLGVENLALTGESWVGGLVGYNEGILTSCYATGSVSGTGGNVGGLAGQNSGTLTSCYATCSVSQTGQISVIGGLVGVNYGTLNSCYATGSVSSEVSVVGGLVGNNQSGTLTSCYATGSVSGDSSVGGLVGRNHSGTLTSCYATGSVSGNFSAGGLVGNNDFGLIAACYATGSVSGTSPLIGGLVGWNFGSLTSCFWDIQTSGQRHDGQSFGLNNEVTGKMTIQMKTLLTFTNAGWADKGWVINDGLDYPRLAWENTGGVPIPQPQDIPLIGSGMADDPYLISTAEEFALLSWYPDVLDKQIKLTDNLDLSGVTIYPIIGNYDFPFMGVFDGNDRIISNAVINQPTSSYVGLFGGVGGGGQIRNLGVENVNITGLNCMVGGLVGRNGGTLISCYVTGSVTGTGGQYSPVGGLVGDNNGTLTSCYVTGSVTGTDYTVGGLVGRNRGTLTSCYATASVTGTGGQYYPVGGLVGYNNGTLTSCYANGSVTGTESRVGGLVGDNDSGTLTSCYATGSVYGDEESGGLVGYNDSALLITACFWDMETSGQGSGVGLNEGSGTVEVYGRTTAQMKMESTFTDYGWDFIGETANGTEDIWVMFGNGLDYPRLAWENSIPVADAGDNQTVYACIDGIAEVTLDGSDSNDIDGDELSYYWSWMIDDVICDANGVAPTIELSVGEHIIELIVNDGIEDSEPNEVVVTVIDSIELLIILTDYILELDLHPGIENSLLAKIDTAFAKLEDDNDKNDKAAATSLQAFINAVEAQSGKKISQDNVDYLIETAQQAIDILCTE